MLPSVKRPRYANVPSFGVYPSRPDRGAGSSLMPVQGNRVNSWPRGMGFPHAASPISFPRSSLAGNMWCPRCNRNHTGNCSVGKQCFACGKLGHMRRDCTTLHGRSGASREHIGRPWASPQQQEDQQLLFDSLPTKLVQS